MWPRRRALRGLDDDIRDHLEREIETNVARGMSAGEARRKALLAFGNPALVRENTRAIWGVQWLQTLRQDVRHGIRILAKHPGVSAAAVLSLAVGIGANTAVFSVVNRVLLEPLPYVDPDRLVMISAVPAGQPGQQSGATIPEYIAWQRQARAFDGMTTAFQQPMTLGGGEEGASPETVLVEKVRSNLFEVLGVRPAIGRAFRPDEEQVDAPAPVVLLSDAFWASRYDRAPDVVGRTIRLAGVSTTIVGVMPADFVFLQQGQTDLFAPLSWNSPQLRGTARAFPIVARLKPGITVVQAQADMDAVVQQTVNELPAQSRGWVTRVGPLRDAMVGDLQMALVLLQSVVGFVLLIACANVAGLLLGRSTSRRTELAVRTAIGAGRGRIVRQLLTESVLLGVVGGVAALVVGWLLLKLLVTMSATFLPTLPAVSIDGRVLLVTLAASVLTGLVVGILPALEASRPDLAQALTTAAKGSSAAFTRQRLRQTIVVVQVAVSFVLLIGAGLTLRSFVRLQTQDLGGDPEGVLRVNVPLTGMFKQVGSQRGYPLFEVVGDVAGATDLILDRLRSLPGVQSVAGASLPPFVAAGPSVGFTIEGRVDPAGAAAGESMTAGYQVVTSGFFSTMRIPMNRGREFDDRDTSGGPWGLVINAAMARRFWPGGDPLGKRVLIDLTSDERPREVIGVVNDYRAGPYTLETEPQMFVLYRQQPRHARAPLGVIMRNRTNFVLRTAVDPASLVGPVRAAMSDLDRQRPIPDVQPVTQYLGVALAPSRYATVVFGLFAGMALLLAAVGAYGVMSHHVGQRTREIGIRMALGAQPLDVLRLTMGQVLVMAGIGLAIGLAGAVALTRLMPEVLAGLAFGIAPMDAVTYLTVSAILGGVAFVAGWMPTRRAIRIGPTVALRCE